LDFKILKTGGIIKQKQKGLFTIRLKCPGGRVPVKKLKIIAEVAEKYAGDYIHISVRQSVELPYVNYKDIGKIQEELAEVGQEIASCGARVRVPSACSGCEYNPNGLTDTQSMANKVCEQFFGKRHLPHKFKMSFSGCPIDCARTNEMDLGFQGAVKPNFDKSLCVQCGICAEACQEKAILINSDTGFPIYKKERCLFCGDCIRCCPSQAITAGITGWIIRCGGKHGRHPILGSKIAEFVPDDKIPDIINAVLDWYEKNGKDRGRIRIGSLLLDNSLFDKFIEELHPVLGEHAVKKPIFPKTIEIHF